MHAHLVKNHGRNCENASGKVVNAALAIKFPNANISVTSFTCSTCLCSSSDASKLFHPPPKKPKQNQITLYVFKGLDIPFSVGQAEAFQAQRLQAIISTGAAFTFFKDPMVQLLFKMARTAVPAIIPSGKTIGGGLLNVASGKVEENMKRLLQGSMIGIVDDMMTDRKEHEKKS